MNKVTALRRLAFGGVRLDEALPEGAYRRLTEEEIETLRAQASGK
jgi:16S rRNA U516 pseudouridylate synthase RsuA-like enzyme